MRKSSSRGEKHATAAVATCCTIGFCLETFCSAKNRANLPKPAVKFDAAAYREIQETFPVLKNVRNACRNCAQPLIAASPRNVNLI